MKDIQMPQSGTEEMVVIQPGEHINIVGVSFDQVSVDIVGTDIVIFNEAAGSKLVFPGMGLLIFEQSLAPEISFGGESVGVNKFVSRVGEVGNLTVKDFIAISSILPQKSDSEEENLQSAEVDAKSEKQQETVASSSSAPTEAPVESQSQSSQKKVEEDKELYKQKYYNKDVFYFITPF